MNTSQQPKSYLTVTTPQGLDYEQINAFVAEEERKALKRCYRTIFFKSVNPKTGERMTVKKARVLIDKQSEGQTIKVWEWRIINSKQIASEHRQQQEADRSTSGQAHARHQNNRPPPTIGGKYPASEVSETSKNLSDLCGFYTKI